ncbi:peptide chain release factor N(5)-glutamine methyltransferase [Yoonia sp.]|uniref:peptide chain release factor N(5)-glutamine methyltransferase n=1 Tax=Yoonia sp. TaxID=2212373 RepID=UPI002FDACF98
MRVADALGLATQRLNAAGIAGAARDARRIMAAALGVAPDRITLMSQEPLASAAEAVFLDLVNRRAAGHPVSHLVGGRLFCDRWFKVTPDVLDPRPETEGLVAAALKVPFADVLDLGTGSGAIILTLLAERPQAVGVAADLSQAALGVAAQNARALGVAERVQFVVSDWFDAVGGHYDLIVANPPYIAADEMAALQPEVRLHEPRMALTDEADGLTAYRKIAAAAPAYLRDGGHLMVEIGPTQGGPVARMMQSTTLSDVRVIPDLDGRDRVVVARKR